MGILRSPGVTPERSEEIRRRISRYSWLSFLGLVGLAAHFGAPILAAGNRQEGGELGGGWTAAVLVGWFGGTILYLVGLSWAALAKGRSGWWGLLGLVSCLGLLTLHFMSKLCQNCSEKASNSAKHCLRCRAPL